MIWAKGANLEELRVRQFLLNQTAYSETAASLASKLGVSSRRCRQALEKLVTEGAARRRDFADIEPIYYRYSYS
jgi:predicted ArsR family transcriptional regulator